MYERDLGPMGPVRTYCKRTDPGEYTFHPSGVTCATCRKAMRRDYCERCGHGKGAHR